MRRLITAALLVLFVSALAAVAQSAAPATNLDRDAVSKQLIQNEINGWEHRKSGDVAFFENQVPGDFTAQMPNGTTEHKADLPKKVQSDKLDNYNARDFNVTFPTADTAIVKYTVSFSGTRRDGSHFDHTRQFTSHYQLRNGQWQNTNVTVQ